MQFTVLYTIQTYYKFSLEEIFSTSKKYPYKMNIQMVVFSSI